MLHVSPLASFVWQSTNSLLNDYKAVSSVVISALGTAVTISRNLSALTDNRTVRDQVKNEMAKVAELVGVLAKLPGSDEFVECRKELQLQLEQSVRKLEMLRRKEQLLALDPQHNLTFWQRLFIWFVPLRESAWIIHVLAYSFMLGGPVTILLLKLLGNVDNDSFNDTVIFIIFGAFAFRTWALAERKWSLQPNNPKPEPGLLTALFVLRQWLTRRMLVAQIGMWSCLFCAVESLEDVVVVFKDALTAQSLERAVGVLKGALTGGVLLFAVSMLAAVLCRTWAAAEWRHPSVQSGLHFPRMLLPLRKNQTAQVWVLAVAYVAVVLAPILAFLHRPAAFLHTYPDVFDRGEFVWVWLASCVAYNRLLDLYSMMAANRGGTTIRQLSHSPADA
jgi:hypothetical protein